MNIFRRFKIAMSMFQMNCKATNFLHHLEIIAIFSISLGKILLFLCRCFYTLENFSLNKHYIYGKRY